MSVVTASNALHKMSKDRSMSPIQDGNSELAAMSKEEPDRPVLVIKVEDRGLPTCKYKYKYKYIS